MFYLKCTGRNEQVRAHHLNCFIAHSRVDSDAVTFLRNAIDTGIQQNVDAIVGQNLKNSGRDIRVLSRNQRRTALDDGHLAPETPIHLGELQADVAPPDDDQMIRQVVHVHHAGIRQIVDLHGIVGIPRESSAMEARPPMYLIDKSVMLGFDDRS